jgi:C-lobe and N-lobe beta barrels of Tf-binding protein B
MKSKMKVLVAMTAAGFLGGCAEPDPLSLIYACAALGSLVGCDPPDERYSYTPPPPTFSKWSNHLNQREAVRAFGPEVDVSYQRATSGLIGSTTAPVFNQGVATDLNYSGVDQLAQFRSQYIDLAHALSSPFTGRDGIDGVGDSGSQTDFSDAAHRQLALVANPYKLGWDYQSFGVWNSNSSGASSVVAASSYGAATPLSALPAMGDATFLGKLAGLYVSPAGEGSMATADMHVDVNFSTRYVQLVSYNTILARGLGASGAPQLDLYGALTYASGSTSFTGTLSNIGGTMSGTTNGHFYGPAAEEVGGVFAVKSSTTVETFTGAYGAKR